MAPCMYSELTNARNQLGCVTFFLKNVLEGVRYGRN